jgi:hypothetical protein
VPTIRVAHLTPERKRAFALADNRLAELGSWDEEVLSVELQELFSMDLDFDIEVTGFDTVDLDRLDKPTEKATAEVVPPVDLDRPAVTQPGDLWQLGHHRLLCGSALQEVSYKAVSSDVSALAFWRFASETTTRQSLPGENAPKTPKLAEFRAELCGAWWSFFARMRLEIGPHLRCT